MSMKETIIGVVQGGFQDITNPKTGPYVAPAISKGPLGGAAYKIPSLWNPWFQTRISFVFSMQDYVNHMAIWIGPFLTQELLGKRPVGDTTYEILIWNNVNS